MAGHRTYHTGLLALAQGAAPSTIPKAVGNAGIAIMSHEAAYGSSNEGRRSGKSPMTANPSVEATNCSKLQFAPHLERVCRAWHESRWVKVPVPGISRAEG